MMAQAALKPSATLESAACHTTGHGSAIEESDQSRSVLRKGDGFYRDVIFDLPVALLQIDLGQIKTVFHRLAESGVTDIALYIECHPNILALSNEIVVIAANREAIKLFGAASESDVLASFSLALLLSQETIQEILIALFNGARSYSKTTKIRCSNNHMREVRLSVAFPRKLAEPGIVLFEDIAERIDMERQMLQLRAEFTHAARISMLGELTTSIAHEVNQPLAAIVTNAEASLRWLAHDEPNLAKIAQLTNRIVACAERANSIVKRIRGMASRSEPERMALDLSEVVDEALMFVRHELEARSIDLVVNFDTSLPRIEGDRTQLEQVIVNLLVNSIQAAARSSGSPRIEIETRREGDNEVRFSIRDNGPGIATENIQRVFETFFTTKDDGVGIGLAICQSIINAHGGTIAAANNAGGGAQFQFRLPAAG